VVVVYGQMSAVGNAADSLQNIKFSKMYMKRFGL